jgi:Ca2+-binding RTX toxin-like protein
MPQGVDFLLSLLLGKAAVMKFARWLGFGRGLERKRRRAGAVRKRPLFGERLEDRSLLTVIVDDGGSACPTLGPSNGTYTSINEAISAPGANGVIQICDGVYHETTTPYPNDHLVNAAHVSLNIGAYSSSPGIVTLDGALSLSESALGFMINGDAAGADYSQLVVQGRDFDDGAGHIFRDGIRLGMFNQQSPPVGNVNLALFGSRHAGDGTPIVLLKNNTGLPIDGAFIYNGATLTEGTPLFFNGDLYFITYQYNGHDVALLEPTPNTAQEVPDPVDSGLTALFVEGTTGNTTIELKPKDITNIEVKVNGVSKLIKPASEITGHIIVYGGTGDDKIVIDPHITIPAILFGEAGKDTLQAGGGPSILVGGDGDDTLKGNKGADILIGGRGKDNIAGGADGDFLIGGFTAFDTDLIALIQLFSDTTSLVAADTDPVHPVTGTVFDDGISDNLDGNAGADYYFANLTSPAKDDVHFHAGEGDTQIDVDPLI